MRRVAAALLAAFLAPAQALAADVGVVLLHGKEGRPNGYTKPVSQGLEEKGYMISTPEMPWSKARIYDATFEEAMVEIDQAVEGLRKKGAKRVIIAGHSMGAGAALGYAASRAGVDGVIALAPGHLPETYAFTSRLGQDVARARSLVADGNGKARRSFNDLNTGKSMSVTTTAEIYLSWFDPEGRAVMPKAAAAFKAPTPLLVIVPAGDKVDEDYFFVKAPPHPKSKFQRISTSHVSLPRDAVKPVADWLATLDAK
ncbi:MAG: alpha/beta fold hydrolase [Elusimicrobia bacterium]|nr:alpha/beta fold hydrolase [Elusimicrobiota bacterium]